MPEKNSLGVSELEEVELTEEQSDEQIAAEAKAELADDGKMNEQIAQSALQAMLSSDPKPLPTEKLEIPRLNMTVTLRGVDEKAIDTIGRRSERQPTKAERARGILTGQRDPTVFNTLLNAEGMVDPDLSNGELLRKHGPRPEDVVRTWFLPGEIIQMADSIMDLSGYGDEAVVRAKK